MAQPCGFHCQEGAHLKKGFYNMPEYPFALGKYSICKAPTSIALLLTEMLTQQQPRHVPLCNRAAHAYPPRLLQVREGGVWSRRPLHRRLLRLRATSRQSRGHGIGKGSWWVNPWRWHDTLKKDETVSHCVPYCVSRRICQAIRCVICGAFYLIILIATVKKHQKSRFWDLKKSKTDGQTLLKMRWRL